MRSDATTISAFLAQQTPERRASITALRATINENLPEGYEEGMLYGGIGWYVPKSILPETYNGQPLALAVIGAQKNYLALYLMSVYGPKLRTWFLAKYKASGKKLDMGKSCIRFKTVEQLAVDVIGETIAKVSIDDYVAAYHKVKPIKTKATARKRPTKKPAAKKRR